MNTQKNSNTVTGSGSLHALREKMVLRSGSSLLVVLLMLVLIPVFFSCGCTEKSLSGGAGGQAALTFMVDDPDQVGAVRELALQYQNKTGTSVSVESVPAGWSPGLSTPLQGDLLVADMSRIPVFAGDRQITLVNPLLNTSAAMNWTLFERPTLVLVGEYPDRSGNIYALPFSEDALGILYRSDLFDNSADSAAFCLSYGYPLGIPGNYDELSDLAGFFSRNGTQISGIGFAGLAGPNPESSPWLSILSSYGSGVVGRSSGVASGTLNSNRALSALSMLRNLSASEPEGAEAWGDREVEEAFSSGRIAMAITWFSHFPRILNESAKNNLSVGVIPLPGQMTDGESHRGVTVSMDGIGLIQGGSNDQAILFLTWFYSPEEQLAYASSGHQPALVPVLDSFPYMSLNAYNRAFPESIRMGVTASKGKNAESVRAIYEDSIREVLASGSSPDEARKILDASSARIESLLKE